jgi:ABC-type multidrug transport system fused ATPase/permease subunit
VRDCEKSGGVAGHVTFWCLARFRWSATALGSLAYLFILSWKLALLVVVLIPVSSFSTKSVVPHWASSCSVPWHDLVLRLYGKYVKKLSKEARKALANATCVAEEAVSNIKTGTVSCGCPVVPSCCVDGVV